MVPPVSVDAEDSNEDLPNLATIENFLPSERYKIQYPVSLYSY